MGDAPDYEYVLFVDEAGDTGLKLLQPEHPNGSSEWMTLSGVLIRKAHEVDCVEWVKEARRSAQAFQGPMLHYKNLSQWRRCAVAEYFSTLPLRAFVVASHKPNMAGYVNERAAQMPSQQWFYNWCLRLLLERVTALVLASSISTFREPRLLKIVMAEKGDHAYSQTRAYIYYLRQQARNSTTVLKKGEVKPDVLNWHLIDAVPTRSSAGAQIADTVASAFYDAVTQTGVAAYYTEPATKLRRVMAKNNGRIDDFGVILQPEPWVSEIPAPSKAIFRYYGHVL